MTADEYVPSVDDVRSVWVVHERDCGWEPHPADPSAEFDRFLARVRRDAYDWGRHDERMSLAYAPPESDGGPGHYPEEGQT